MIINSWDKLTVGKYMEIKSVIDSDLEEAEKMTALLSLLSDIDEDELLDLPLVRYNHMLQNTSFLFTNLPKRVVATKYVLGGVTLDVMLNIEKMTAAQFIDYQNYVKDVEKNLIQLLSIFLIPKGCKYNDGYDIIEIQKLIRDNLCVVDAMSLSAFFLKWYESLLKATVHYLTKQMKKMMKKETNEETKEKLKEVIANLEQSGNGLALLTEYQPQ